MKVTGKINSLTRSLDGKLLLTFEINEEQKCLEEFQKAAKEEKLSISAEKFRAKRSLDANAYFWVLVGKMADVLLVDRDTIYNRELSRYGVAYHLTMPEAAVLTFRDQFPHTDVVGSFVRDGQIYSEVRVCFGSSTYDSKQMSTLINGVVEDCKDLGIETLPPDEIEAMMAAWRG